MKKIIYTIIILFWIFLLNIILFFFNENYNFFVKSLKNPDILLEEKSILINDDYLLDLSDIDPKEKEECICEEKEEIICENNSKEKQNIELEKELVDREKINRDIWEILNYFWEINLQKKEYNEYYLIFWLTDEYPKEYETYVNNNFEIYFFPEYNFIKMYNFFKILSDELNISLNSTNIFKDNSFFINLNNKKDDYIRVVVYFKNILFWLKIKKDYYMETKKILQNF